MCSCIECVGDFPEPTEAELLSERTIMNKKHIHAHLIHAWADGAIIEFKTPTSTDWLVASTPGWDEHTLYRIKPANKVRYGMVNTIGDEIYIANTKASTRDQIKVTFEGNTNKIIAVELVNQE